MARVGGRTPERRNKEKRSSSPIGGERRRRGRPKGESSQVVHATLRQRILDVRLAPGENLDELAIVEEFGVSRTPVREALIRLASEGLVTIAPGLGARVTPMDIADIPQLIEASELCHRIMNRWSALRRTHEDLVEMKKWSDAFADAASREDAKLMSEANRQFHLAIAKSCGNKYLHNFYEQLSSSSLRLARLTYAKEPAGKHHGEIVRQHEAMIDAIRCQNAEAADHLAGDHAMISRSIVRTYIETSLAGASPLDWMVK